MLAAISPNAAIGRGQLPHLIGVRRGVDGRAVPDGLDQLGTDVVLACRAVAGDVTGAVERRVGAFHSGRAGGEDALPMPVGSGCSLMPIAAQVREFRSCRRVSDLRLIN